MRISVPTGRLLGFGLLLCLIAAAHRARAQNPEPPAGEKPVTLTEDAAAYTLANGYVTARVDKQSGSLISLVLNGHELMGKKGGRWTNYGGGRLGSLHQATVRIDPTKTGGARAEVEIRATYDGKAGTLPADQELRYALGRGDCGVYATQIWTHKAGYPAFSVGEGRYVAWLNPAVFDYMTIDADRRKEMITGDDWVHGTPLNMKEVRRMNTGLYAGQVEHKYDYAAIIPDTPAYGWSSTNEHVGLWFINPSFEYFAGGPTKVELTGHRDVGDPGDPVLLNMWLGSHYGGSSLIVSPTESWIKVVGPFLIYANAGPSHEAMWKDALTQAAAEKKKWPYPWEAGPSYPAASGRATVTGQIIVSDPEMPSRPLRNLCVGLAAPDYSVPATDGFPPTVDWQRDAKYYGFWVRGDGSGRFTIPNVRPGTYTLHAIADGVLGEYAKTGITVTVAAGKPLDLGRLTWTPLRFGRQVWQIGTPDRSAAEFRHGDHYWQWGLYYQYPKDFPRGVNFVVGKSDYHTDWNYAQVARLTEGPDGKAATVQPTTWTVTFPMTRAAQGRAMLRLAFCGSRLGCNVAVSVNGKPVGETGPLPSTGVMHRDGIRGYWYERDIPFDAVLLKPGTNTIRLASHADNWTQAVLYDCLRLEIDEKTAAAQTTLASGRQGIREK